MDATEYQFQTGETAVYPRSKALEYLALGLGEAGEIQGKVKKIIRDGADDTEEEMEKRKLEIAEECGDLLWYIAQLLEVLGYTMGYVMQMNLDKLKDRAQRGVLKGSGDKR